MTSDEALEIADAHCDAAMTTDADVPCALVTLAADVKRLRTALAELVRLKDMKDSGSYSLDDYMHGKIAAWKAARQLLTPNAEAKPTDRREAGGSA